MRRRVAALVTAALPLVAATLAWSSPAQADVPGFEVNVGQPGTFTIGKAAKTLTAVTTTDRGGRCLKVRWGLEVQTEGISLDQLKITRIENDQAFPVRARLDEDGATIVDVGLDPGQLCRDRTVTAQWNIGFTGPDDGSVSFEVKAADAGGELLATGGTDTQVVTAVAAKPSATPSAEAQTTEPTPEPADSADPTEAAIPPAATTDPADAASLARTSSSTSILAPGLLVGAVLVLLGVFLLVRLRKRLRPGGPDDGQNLPTGFYNLPSRRPKT